MTDEIYSTFDAIFTGSMSPDQTRDFLVRLYHRGETTEEILGAVTYLRDHGISIKSKHPDLIDCCGTGGDLKGTFNVSTAVAFVLAGGGCHVAKHGNRAVSSKSGSADILSALAVNIALSPEDATRCLDEIGISFLMAPTYYPLLKTVADVRKSIPHRTIFNLLGPLLNPAKAKHQLIGVFDKKFMQPMTEVLKATGSKYAVIVHADNGMDELSLSCNNRLVILKEGMIIESFFDPRESGYAYCHDADLNGGTPEENAARLKKCLKGHSEPLDHTVHINAAWGFMAAGKAKNFMDGLLMAQDSISSGRAYQKLEALIEFTRK